MQGSGGRGRKTRTEGRRRTQQRTGATSQCAATVCMADPVLAHRSPMWAARPRKGAASAHHSADMQLGSQVLQGHHSTADRLSRWQKGQAWDRNVIEGAVVPTSMAALSMPGRATSLKLKVIVRYENVASCAVKATCAGIHESAVRSVLAKRAAALLGAVAPPVASSVAISACGVKNRLGEA